MAPAKRVKPIEILLVDDDDGDVRLMCEALEESKIDNAIHVVRDGVEALAYLRAEPPYEGAARPDLVLLDLNLPRKDGREVLAEVKQDPSLRTVPVVVLTTSTSDSDVLRAYLHANAYVSKPVDLESFLDVVRSIDDFFFTVARLPPTAEGERDLLEDQLRQSQRLESLGQLAGGVAHDFNNLLGAILNYAEFVGEAVADAEKGPDGERWTTTLADVEQIKSAAKSAALLTRQLLSFARREVTQPRVLNPNAVIEEVEQLLRRTLGEHVELLLSLEPDPALVLADPMQVEQVLVNLAVNARDAMPSGGTLTLETENLRVLEGTAQDDLPPGAYLQLRVRDTGVGIPPELLDKVFDPFFTTKPEGTGLGLATVYGIVRQAGGRVLLTSQLQVGTTVTIVLPATQLLDAVESSSAAAPPAQRGGHTVLVVEDDPAIRDVTTRILARGGLEVLTAGNGPDALELVEQHTGRLDLILTDVVMPQMLGTELVRRVTALRPDLKVLYMSGYAQAGLGGGGQLDPGVALIDKPFSEQALLARVRDVLEGSVLEHPAVRDEPT